MSKDKAKETRRKERSVEENTEKDEIKEMKEKIQEEQKKQSEKPVNEELANEEKAEVNLEDRNKELEEEVLNLKDQLLRKLADFENFKKRINKDKDDSIRYSNQMILLDLVEIIDDFERAIKSSEESKDFDVFHSGIVMIENRLVSMLDKKWGLSRFNSLGELFDPEKHQAIALEESSDCDDPKVIEDYQKGYFFRERVLRPAKVKVTQPVAEKTVEKATENETNE